MLQPAKLFAPNDVYGFRSSYLYSHFLKILWYKTLHTFTHNSLRYIFVHDFTNYMYIIYFNNLGKQKFLFEDFIHSTGLSHLQTCFHAIFAVFWSADAFSLKHLQTSLSNRWTLIHLYLISVLSSTNCNPSITQACNHQIHEGLQPAKIFPFTIQCRSKYTHLFHNHLTQFFTVPLERYCLNYWNFFNFFKTRKDFYFWLHC